MTQPNKKINAVVFGVRPRCVLCVLESGNFQRRRSEEDTLYELRLFPVSNILYSLNLHVRLTNRRVTEIRRYAAPHVGPDRVAAT